MHDDRLASAERAESHPGGKEESTELNVRKDGTIDPVLIVCLFFSFGSN